MASFDTNKAVKSYRAGGNSYVIRELLPLFKESPYIPQEHVLAVTLICANRNLNGGQIPGISHLTLYPPSQVEYLVNNPEMVKDVYEAIQPHTIQRYIGYIERVHMED